ncbi:short-chain dehydrogenase/reductase family 9C member 7 isoform X1 [Dermatophagoides farinae]
MSMIRKLFRYFIPSFIGTYILWYLLNPGWFNHFCIICFLSVIAWTMAYYFYEMLNQETIDPSGKIVLVTGCDTGFGNRTAYRLDQLGFHVYAGVLFPDGDGAKQLQQKCSKRLKILKMDVTKPEEVKNVVEQIKQSGKPLWALVNNAGVGVSVPFDWGNDVDIHQKVFDVNVFGLIRVTKYCMPLLRQSNGRIVNLASLAGRVRVGSLSSYCMAKHSVRVLSDCIRAELIGTGIKVVTLEPSFYKTEIINFDLMDQKRRKIYDETPEDIRESYGENYLEYLRQRNSLVQSVTKTRIDDVVDSIIDGIIREYPKLYYRCCSYQELFTMWGTSHLPEILLDYVMTKNADSLLRKTKAGPYHHK